MTTHAELLAIDSHGQYIPQYFSETYDVPENFENYESIKEDLQYLKAGPDQEHYWETWDNVLNTIMIIKGERFILMQDGDLWAVPETEVDQIEEF